jgi:nucleoside 2-deoxyribosyltransferase
MKNYNVYVAGPLFSLAERDFNNSLVKALGKKVPEIAFILPQIYAKNVSGQNDFIQNIFHYCIESIDKADVLLCILDGPDVDSGTCIEMGYAYARNKTIIGVRTDSRDSEDRGVNLMVSNVCHVMIWLRGTDLRVKLVDEIASALKKAISK